jgi:hypothetical protein
MMPWLTEFATTFVISGREVTLAALDYVGVIVLLALAAIYLYNIVNDAKGYAMMDPMPK